jgi:hypothetical protein
MGDIDHLALQIKHNCDISDAHYAGMFSVCGLALRFRDLYKWEVDLPPWEERDTSSILDWIGEREDRWAGLGEEELSALSFDGLTWDPFDTRALNDRLEPMGYFYGAGLAHGLKPSFFLASVLHTTSVESLSVVTVGRELARDLLALPALVQDRRILLRHHAALSFFWDQMVYVNPSGRSFLVNAVSSIGGRDASAESLRRHASELFDVQRDIYLRHEIGELLDTTFDIDVWREIIAEHAHTPVELLARALKDLLADTHPSGTLPFFIRNRNQTALNRYAAFLGGLMKPMLTEIAAGCETMMRSGTWGKIEDAVRAGRSTAVEMTRQMIDLHRERRRGKDPKWVGEQIQQRLLSPLVTAGGSGVLDP